MKTIAILTCAAISTLCVSVMSTAPAAAATLTNSQLKNYCDTEKHRRGAARAGVRDIVNRFNRWNQPDLRCLMAFPTGRQAWLIADASTVCRYVSGNSQWTRRGNSTFCNGSAASNSGRVLRPVGNIRFPRYRTCRRIGFRYVCR